MCCYSSANTLPYFYFVTHFLNDFLLNSYKLFTCNSEYMCHMLSIITSHYYYILIFGKITVSHIYIVDCN